MGKYVVRSGENIFDVAMNVYGGIEGVFDLLVCNQDAASQSGLSLCDTLTPGMELGYTDGFTVNQDVLNWFKDNGIIVRNGEHTYGHIDVISYMTAYAKAYNQKVLQAAMKAVPSVARYPETGITEDEEAMFIDCINDNCMLIGEITSEDFDDIISGDTSCITDIVLPDRISIPFLVIKHTGNLSVIKYELGNDNGSFIIIDWGDATQPDMDAVLHRTVEAEHCYDDDGSHVIKVYGTANFQTLDLGNVNGTYYPTREITVHDTFTGNTSNETINELIRTQ